MVKEYSSIMMNDVWEVVSGSEDRSIVGSRWIYKNKYVADGSVDKYKATFMAKGSGKGMGWKIHQMDVKMTFLNGGIEEEVYIEQPEGSETLYRLKQAPRAWYGRIDNYLQQMGFVKGDADPNLYYLMVEDEPLILDMYVDDLFLIGSSRLIKDYKRNLATKFDMKNLVLMHYFLGLEVGLKDEEIFLGQGRYLKRFRIQDCRPMSMPMITNWKKIDSLDDKDVDPTLYRELIGSLMYLVKFNARSDICFSVNTLSQFMVEPKRVHWTTTRHILRYLRDTIEYGLKYTRGDDARLCGFTDANWAGNLVDRKRTFGYCFSVGSGMVSWCNRKQKSVTLSSAEAEYTSYIKLYEMPVFHDRLKHIYIQCHFIRDCVQHGAVQLQYVPTEEQFVDILTKALGRAKFVYFIEQMGIVENAFQ
eukprot:PITA_27413